MSDRPLEHPALSLRRWRVSAPPPLPVLIAADGFLFVSGGVLALVDGPLWACLVPLALAAPAFIVYGRKAAEALGIHSRDQAPRGLLTVLGMLGAVGGVLATHTGRYAAFTIAIVIALSHVGERLAWVRFDASR